MGATSGSILETIIHNISAARAQASHQGHMIGATKVYVVAEQEFEDGE
jgi:hypothetical protein